MSTGAGLGMGLSLSTAESAPAMAVGDMAAPHSTALSAGAARRGVVSGGTDARHGVSAPGLLHPDVQSTFRGNSSGSYICPPIRLPCLRRLGAKLIPSRREMSTPTWKMICSIRAEADDLGDLKALRLEEARLPDLVTLGKRLRRYTELLEGRPLRVRLVADDRLRYEPAARIIATCSAAGVTAIRLTQPGATPLLPGGGPKPEPIRKSGNKAGGL